MSRLLKSWTKIVDGGSQRELVPALDPARILHPVTLARNVDGHPGLVDVPLMSQR
jgi:hypothetical protein